MFRRLFVLLLCLACLAGASPNWAQSRRERAKTKTTRRKSSERTREKADDTPKRKRTARRDDAKPAPKRTTRKDEPRKTARQPKASSKTTGAAGKKPLAGVQPGNPRTKPTATAPAKNPKAAVKSSPSVPTAKSEAGKPTPVAAKPVSAAPAKTSPATGDPLKDGDRRYTEKSFAAALRAYRQAIALKKVPQARRPLVDYRIARCYALTQQWTQALSEPLAVAARYPGTIWDARMRAWLMRVYLIVPHEGWKVGTRTVRGKDFPEGEGDERPERIYLTDDDQRKAVQYGEQAKALYEKVREGQPDTTEEADHSADLARTLATVQMRSWAQTLQWKSPQDESWMLDPDANLNPAWAPPRKVLQLFLAAERLGSDQQKPLARLAQAVWLHNYHDLMKRTAVKRPPMGPPEPIPYPYQERDDVAMLRSLVQDYPTHAQAEHARVMVADWLNDEGRYAAALAVYRGFLIDKPESPWAAHAKAAAEEITRKVLEVKAPEPQAPGTRAKLEISGRNLPVLKFTAQRVKLEDAVKDARVLARPQEGFTELLGRIGKVAGLQKHLHAEDPVTWEVPFAAEPGKPEPAEFAPFRRSIETPLTKNGAYLVQVDGGPVRQSVLLLISDLAVMQVVDERRAHAMVVNAVTGAPVFEASALIRELYKTDKDKRAVSAATVTTDADGMAEKPLSPARTHTDDLVVFAWKGDRYAFTEGYTSRGKPADRDVEQNAFSYTDRAVYRPGQRLHYRALLASRSPDEAWKPLPGLKAVVQVHGPNRELVAEQQVTANRFGSVSGQVDLGSGARLGKYWISVGWPRDEESEKADDRKVQHHGSTVFQVEEYKRPEFAVTVSPVKGANAPRPGEMVEAEVSARYYFGAPVANARVKYTVTTDLWHPVNPFSEDPIDSDVDEGTARASLSYDHGIWRAPVAVGTAVTDAQGLAAIRFKHPTPRPGTRLPHLRFSIEAEVTDASRRSIHGRGSVAAPETQFLASVRATQGFFTSGEPLEAELVTQDPSARPVAAAGTVVVLRRTFRGDQAVYQEVHRAPARTDATGKARFTWAGATGGYYRVRFESVDDGDRPVLAQTGVWVAGEPAGESVDPDERVALVKERSAYPTGSTARVLVVSRAPDQPLYLVRGADGRLLEKRFLRLTGASQVLDVPIGMQDVPDVTLTICGIRDRASFDESVGLDVQPSDHLLQLQVTSDKSRYQPGEQATFKVRARDAAGKPVRVDCSVGIVDTSLDYFQNFQQHLASGLYSGYRGGGLSSDSGLTLTFETLSEDDQPPSKSPELDWKFPGGLGSISPDATNSVDAGAFAVIESGLTPRMMYTQSLGPGGPPGPPGVTPAQLEELRGGRLEKMGADIRSPAPRAGLNAPPPQVRRNFSETAFWNPEVVTDANGEATVTFTWPDSLTRWRTTVRGWTESAQVGEATSEVETSKDLLVRLQSPRFFVERDEIVLSANVHNYTSTDRRIRVGLQLGGDTLYPAGSSPFGPPQPLEFEVPRADRPRPVALSGSGSASTGSSDLVRWVEVPAQGEARVDWTVRAERPGEARVRVLAESDTLADAVELKFPTYVHGAGKIVVRNGALIMTAGEKPGKREVKIPLQVPVERVPDAGQLVVQVSPSLAATVLDSLPYLVDYPYGCVEQTLSRFLPAVVSAKALQDLGLELSDLQKRAEAEYARRKNAAPVSVVANSPYTSPEALAAELGDLERARWHAQRNPVFRPATLQSMVQQGLQRLREAQNANGSWGWWKGDAGDERMTAYVVHGLLTGRAAGMEKPEALAPMIEKGMAFLAAQFPKEVNRHDQVLLGWVLSMDRKRAPAIGKALLEKVYPQREALTAYSLALLALTLKQCGLKTEAQVCLANLENTAKIDRQASTCYWNNDRGTAWGWWNHDVETAAACLRAYNSIEPGHRLAPLVVRWLTNNRRGTTWDTTRATAMAVQALIEYAKLHKELEPDCRVTVALSDGPSRTFTLNADSALLADGRFVIPATALGPGTRTVTITREGKGSLYYTATLQYFTLEEGIRGTTGEVRVARRYFRLTRPADKDDQKDEKTVDKPALTRDGYVRSEVRPGEKLTSGDLLEVELVLESKNTYEHLVLEDMKPAGCEPVDLISGSRYADGLCSNMELRDEKIAFFLTQLPQGKRRLSYRLRAEVPGRFHTLPVSGYAMYAPEIRFLSDEALLSITDPEKTAARE